MSALDLLALCQARPFRPFRVTTASGDAFTIERAEQAAIAPDLSRLVILFEDGRTLALKPADIAACTLLETEPAHTPPAGDSLAAAPSQARPCQCAFLVHTQTDGARIVSAGVMDQAGTSCFTTAGLRWDVHGAECFENGVTLWMHHADDPLREIRLLVWPPAEASFETYAEAMPLPEVLEALKRRDAALREAAAATPRPEAAALAPPKQDEPAPCPTPGEGDDFVLEFEHTSVGKNDFAATPHIRNQQTRSAVLDLRGTRWDAAPLEADPPRIRLRFRRYPRGSETFETVIDPVRVCAHIDGARLPLAYFERLLRNYPAHGDWEALLEAFRDGPARPGAPELSLSAAEGRCRVELWPGVHGAPLPFLVPRILGPNASVQLDLRNSAWGAQIEIWKDAPKLTFQLLHQAPREREALLNHWFVADLLARRITCRGIPGATAFAALQQAAHACTAPSVLLDRITEAMARGVGIPLP